jgi:hypothetical protein
VDDRGVGALAAQMEISPEELLPLWDAFRTGAAPVACPRDGGPVAVAVDATAHAYRMVCVRCGAATAWFESRPTGIHVRTGTSSMPVARQSPSEEEPR